MFPFRSLCAIADQMRYVIHTELKSIRFACPIGSIDGGMRDMMRLKVKQLGEGLHPSEMFVSVETRDGPQDLAVDPTSIHGGTLAVGWPVGREENYLLVELPRPTSLGSRRVWVRKDELITDKSARQSA
jgi:hypothetical protein